MRTTVIQIGNLFGRNNKKENSQLEERKTEIKDSNKNHPEWIYLKRKQNGNGQRDTFIGFLHSEENEVENTCKVSEKVMVKVFPNSMNLTVKSFNNLNEKSK